MTSSVFKVNAPLAANKYGTFDSTLTAACRAEKAKRLPFNRQISFGHENDCWRKDNNKDTLQVSATRPYLDSSRPGSRVTPAFSLDVSEWCMTTSH
jgi:hypothetical protein